MKPENEAKIEARLTALRSQMDSIPALLDGALLTKHNRTLRKDGSVHVSPAYYTFQYLAPDGKRAWKRIPKGSKIVVERLVKAGATYHKLSREYTALLTELSLDGSKKKTLDQTPSTPDI
jgi:hypothetical protein